MTLLDRKAFCWIAARRRLCDETKKINAEGIVVIYTDQCLGFGYASNIGGESCKESETKHYIHVYNSRKNENTKAKK